MNPEDEKDVQEVIDMLLSLQNVLVDRLDKLVKDSEFKANPEHVEAELQKLVKDLKANAQEKMNAYKEQLKKSPNYNRIANLLK